MSIAYIALGSNLGDKEANLRQALKMLLVKGLQIRSVSSFFKTEPYGVTDQPEFINRLFVLQPLSEIAADKIHPVYKKSIQNLLKSLTDGDE